MYVGELADLLIGISTVFVSSMIYKYVKTKKGGILGLVFGTITWVIVAILANGTFLINFYKEVAGIDAVIGMCKSIFPNMTESNFMSLYLLGAVLPFNFMLASIVSIVAFLVYKKISFLFKKDFVGKNKKEEKQNENTDNI
jgi:integral membrane protein